VGGGGLISGVAAALAVERPEVRVVGVEAAGAASMVASLAAGAPVELTTVRTIADGIALKSPSALTFAHVQALVDDVVTVTDEEIGRALILLLERAKAVVEPSGAVGLAALLAGKVPGSGPAAVVLSGGNVDSLMLTRLVEHGLSAAGRYLRLRVVVPDRPGALAGITQTVADLGINVLAVEHHRAGVQVGLGDVEVLLTLETRDAEHRRQVVAALLERGVAVEPLG
jgi:threonine dehydratase